MKRKLFTLLCLSVLHLSAQNALNFDGSNDFVGTSYAGISGNGARTVEAMIRTSNSISGQKVIVDWGSMAPGTRFTFNVLQNASIRIEVGGSGMAASTAVNDGMWHHVAVTYDPTLSSDMFKLYIDGSQAAAGNLNTPVNTSSVTPVLIGCRNDSINYFPGDIDEVRIWDRALTATEISANKSAELCGTPSGLKAYYKFNQGTAGGANASVNTLSDELGLNNGSLNNFGLSGASSNWVAGATLSSGSKTSSITETACNSYLSPAGKTYTTSGNYTDTLQATAGCDSIIDITLTVQAVDTSVTVSSTTLKANRNNATYRWLDCNDNYKIVVGGTTQTFTPPDPNGSYAVSVEYGGCKDTSACYSLDGVGLFENKISSLDIFPNPSKGNVQISHPSIGTGKLIVLSATGQVIFTSKELGTEETEINLSSQPKGIYFIKLESDGESFVERLVLE